MVSLQYQTIVFRVPFTMLKYVSRHYEIILELYFLFIDSTSPLLWLIFIFSFIIFFFYLSYKIQVFIIFILNIQKKILDHQGGIFLLITTTNDFFMVALFNIFDDLVHLYLFKSAFSQTFPKTIFLLQQTFVLSVSGLHLSVNLSSVYVFILICFSKK